MRHVWPLLLASIIALLATLHASLPPAPLPENAASTLFSATRAMVDVRAVGRAPHPVGSADHARVRALLVARMAALGLHPRVAAGRAIKTRMRGDLLDVDGAEVRNIVGVLPGRDRRASAVLLMAHYDSVPASPGAADDGAGLSAGLEVVRALRAGGTGQRDLILLFTDAEENGLLGARAFFASDPAAARVGFVVNMDMRGGGGRAIMHETGHRAGGTMALYRASAVHPTTDSIAAWVERLIRNSSDFRITVDRDLPGLNYAILDRQFDYHAASSTPDRLDPRSLQHLGEQVLAATRALVDAEALPARTPDPAYASLLGLVVAVYPTWAGWLILGVTVVLAEVARRCARVTAAETLRSTAAALHLLVTVALALMLARAATAVPHGFVEGRALLAWWPLYEAMLALVGAGGVMLWRAGLLSARCWLAGLAPVVLAVALLLCGAGGWTVAGSAFAGTLAGVAGFGRPLRTVAHGFGLFACIGLVAVAVQAVAPLVVVDMLLALLGGSVVLLLCALPGRMALLAAALLAGLLVAQHLSTAHLLLLAVGETLPAVAAPFALYAALALAPIVDADMRRSALLGGGTAGAVLATLLVLRFVDPASEATPAASHIVHVSDLASGRFHRVTSLAAPDRWTREALGRARPAALPPFYEHAGVARGERVPIAPPRITLSHRDDGKLLLVVEGRRDVREIALALASSTPLVAMEASGMPVPLARPVRRIERLRWVGASRLTLLLTPAGAGRLVVRIGLLADGWPAAAYPLPPRPPESTPWYDSDAHMLLQTKHFAWVR